MLCLPVIGKRRLYHMVISIERKKKQERKVKVLGLR